jgi:hypothetical protein
VLFFFFLLHSPAKSTEEVHQINCIRDSTTPALVPSSFEEERKKKRVMRVSNKRRHYFEGVVALCFKENDDKLICRMSE